MSIAKNFSQTQRIVLLGMLGALGTLLMFIELPFVFYNFLRIDLSDVVVLVTFVVFGYKEGIMVGFIKALIHFMLPLLNPTGGVGELAAFIASVAYIAGIYIGMKKLKMSLVPSLIFSVVVMTLIMTFMNWILITPLFGILYGGIYPNIFNGTYIWGILSVYIPFNLLKGVVVMSVFYGVYRILKLTFE